MEATTAIVADEPNAAYAAVPRDPARPAAVLKGTARGLEAIVDGGAPVEEIVAALTKRLDEAPAFFRGSDVRVRVEDGPLPAGCLSRLDELAARFELRVVEVGPAKKPTDGDGVPRPSLAAGSAPAPVTPLQTDDFAEESPTSAAVSAAAYAPALDELSISPLVLEPAAIAELSLPDLEPAIVVDAPTENGRAPLQLAAMADASLASDEGTRIVIGPIRSGVVLEHTGHLFVFGDVNPGAEVRATGNIVVLGRLRGTAHAAIGQDVGFILALRLEPQQLRIGRKVARAGDSDTPSTDAEIASSTGAAIVVEPYLGKLPKNLATSL